MENREAHDGRMAAQQERWDDHIEAVQARIKRSQAGVKLRRADDADELRARQNKTSEKLTEPDDISRFK